MRSACSRCIITQELSLAVPDSGEETGGDEPSSDDPVNATSDSPIRSSNPASPLCPSPSRHLQHLHSSVLVTFDESDIESDKDQGSAASSEPASSPGQATQNVVSPPKADVPDALSQEVAATALPGGKPRATRAVCTSGIESVKPGASTGKGSTLQELKPATRRMRVAHFAETSETAAGDNAKKAGEAALRLPKLETSKQRAASMGGGLAGGGGTSKSPGVSSSGAAGEVSRPASTQLPPARRARASSASAPGEIISEAPEKVQPHKGPAQGIPAVGAGVR